MKYLLIACMIISTNLSAVPWASEGIKKIQCPPAPTQSKLRITSTPYISTDSYRTICDHVCDETDAIFKPESVQYGDTIYLTSYIVQEFFEIAHPRIKFPYILVTGYGDQSHPSTLLHYLNDPKVLAWFGTNCDIVPGINTKFIPIPIGLANKYFDYGNTKIMAQIQKNINTVPKQYLLGLNFAIRTNVKERSLTYAAFENKKYCKIFLDKYGYGVTDYQSYLTDMARCKFIISPHGNGLDCYRTWEALLLNTIPIIKQSTLDPLYTNLPVIVVNNWSDVTEKFLNEQYEIINNKQYNFEKIYFSYWENLIKTTQSEFRKIGSVKCFV